MRLRRLSQKDLDRVVEIDSLCFEPAVSYPREVFAACLAESNCAGYGIDQDGELASFAVLYFFPRTMQLITIDVHPNYRRRGHADALMEQMEMEARDRGSVKGFLQVAVENLPARALYEKWGFEAMGELPDYYGRDRHALLMQKIYRRPRSWPG